MGGRAEEIQTNTAMFASRIHKKKEGETVNTETQTATQRALDAFLWGGCGAELHWETEAHTVGTDRGHVAEVEGSCLSYMKYKRFFITSLTTNKRGSQNNSQT